MQTIIPAIIPKSYEHLRFAAFSVLPFATEIQIDIVDGKFVPYTSWPYAEGDEIMDLSRITDTFSVEMDLMIVEPEKVIPLYAEAGVKEMVVHLESTKQLAEIVEMRAVFGFNLGFSIGNDTPLTQLVTSIREYQPDYVQLMGIPTIGAQGKPFDERVLGSVRTLRNEFPELMVSIDGSVNQDTLPRLKEAGANRFVAGSSIFAASDMGIAYRELTALAR